MSPAAFIVAIGLALLASGAVLAPLLRRPATGAAAPAIVASDSFPERASADGAPRSRRPVAVAIAIALVTCISALLVGSVADRSDGQPMTGSLPTIAPPSEPGSGLAAVRRQVRSTPGDTDARLELGRAEMDAGHADRAAEQFRAVLALDPSNAEALARLGFILAISGRPRDGLHAIGRSLSLDPSFSEAYLLRAVVLARVLHRPDAARRATRRYLAGT